MPVVAKQRVHFGPFELDVHAGELFKHGTKLKLQGHPIQILAMLVEKPGELITREEIQQKLWPSESETFVDFEHGLNTAVRKLRQALGDEAETPQYIETLPRRGYRFVGDVTARAPGIVSAPGLSTSASNRCEADSAVRAAPEIAVASEPGEPTSRGDQSRWKQLWSGPLVILFILLAVLGIAAVLLRPGWLGPGTMRIVDSRRLTFNDRVYARTEASLEFYDSLHSDGRRVYYTVENEQPLRFVSVNGGNESVLPNAVHDPLLLDLSPDGSTLLIIPAASRSGESPVWMMPAEGGPARKLGDVEAQDAAFAPDGKTIVFASGTGIFLTDLQGHSPLKLTEVSGRAFWLRWSPDGAKLRFSVVNPEKLTYTLWEMQSRGKPRQLLTNWEKDAQICCGVWTAKGEYFLFRKIYGPGSGLWAWSERGLLATYPSLLTASGMEIGSVVASPLGKTLFAAEAASSAEVLLRNPETGEVKSLDLGLPISKVAYSRDGKMMAANVRDGAGIALWRISADGKDRQQLTSTPLEVFMADYSPDGKRIAFMGRTPGRPWKIYWVSATGGETHEISSEVANQADPNWSPDGQSIFYGQPPQYMSETGAQRNMYIYDFRTGKSSKVPSTTGLFSPRWSPDGRYVAALALDHRSLMVLDLKDGVRKTLEHEIVMHPFWSPDSAWVYFNSGEPMTLWRYRVGDGHLEQVAMNIDAQRCTPWMAMGTRPDGSVHVTCVHVNRDIYALDWK